MRDFKELIELNLDSLESDELFSLIEGFEKIIVVKKNIGKLDSDINSDINSGFLYWRDDPQFPRPP